MQEVSGSIPLSSTKLFYAFYLSTTFDLQRFLPTWLREAFAVQLSTHVSAINSLISEVLPSVARKNYGACRKQVKTQSWQATFLNPERGRRILHNTDDLIDALQANERSFRIRSNFYVSTFRHIHAVSSCAIISTIIALSVWRIGRERGQGAFVCDTQLF